MITTDLTGNIGNHLFQYALCRTIAEKRGFDWGVNPIPYGDYYSGQSQIDFLNIHYGSPIEGIVREHIEQKISIPNSPANAVWMRYEPTLIDTVEDNTKITGAWQTEKYFLKNKDNIKDWYSVNSDVKKQVEDLNILDENTCVINIRGGEYRNHPELVIQADYYKKAMDIMIKKNPNMKFVVVTDDVPFAHSQLQLPTYHYNIAIDWCLINEAKWLILSNSSFAWFPAWLNDDCNMVITPKYWARHNVSDGYWASSDIFTKGWLNLDREGCLYDYDMVVEEVQNGKYNSFKGEELI
tara:strand:+ start:10818 stop:11705 length:888 start_codon:yes stop_codon:yes gene_type:complete